MKQQEPCPGCGGKPDRWYARMGHALMFLMSMEWGINESNLARGGWNHTTSSCPVWASARADVQRKKER